MASIEQIVTCRNRLVPRHVSATPMAAAFLGADASARQSVLDEVQERMTPYQAGAAVRVPFRTHLATGTR